MRESERGVGEPILDKMACFYSKLVSCFSPPTPLQVFDNYAVTVMIGGEPYTLGLFDTAGENVNFSVFILTRNIWYILGISYAQSVP